MEGIVDDVVRVHFDDDEETVISPMVIIELNKYVKNPKPLESLTLKCIKNIIRNQVKPQSVAEVRYKLIFQEPLDIIETSQHPHDPEETAKPSGLSGWLWSALSKIVRFGPPERLLKNDPVIMLNVLEQNLCSRMNRTVYVFIMEKMCRVEVNRELVVEVPNEEGVNFDTHWALIFGNQAFRKNIYYVEFLLEVKSDFNWDRLKTWMENFISNFSLVSPDEPEWNAASRRTDRVVYLKSNLVLKNQEFFTQVFIAERDWLDQNPEYRRIYNE